MAQYVTVAGTQVALPDNARPDQAFQRLTFYNTSAVAPPFDVDYPGDYYVVLLTVRMDYAASAVVGNRYPRLLMQNENGTSFWASTVLAAVTANTSTTLYGIGGASTAYTSGAGEGIVPLPTLLIQPSYSVRFTAVGQQAGDTVGAVRVTELAIPSGPQLPTLQATTPLLS